MTHPDGANANATTGSGGTEKPTWREASPAEARALEAAAPGAWVRVADAAELVSLEETIAALERRKANLEAEISDAVSEARERGRSEGANEARCAVETLVASGAVLADRAARAAIEVAEALVGETLEREPAPAVRALVQRGLDADRARTVRRVRVAPAHVGAVRTLLDVHVDSDPGLSAGDVAVEYPDGQRVQRLTELLAAMLPAVRAHLIAGLELGDE